MTTTKEHTTKPVSTVRADLVAGLVVFLVALPLCLGIAMADKAPLTAGIWGGIIGGLVVGWLSGSHTSVSGPSAGSTAVVIAALNQLGSFEAFLLALFIGGLIQIVLGLTRTGFIAEFFPSSVINGLLAAIGVILVLKQIPHVLGRDTDPEGEMSFFQPDKETTLSEFGELIDSIHPGAAVIGLVSVAILAYWDRCKPLKRTGVPAALAVVLFGVLMTLIFQHVGGAFEIASSHLVQVPVAKDLSDYLQFFQFPDFSKLGDIAVYQAALTIAMVASLETLLNIEAVDKVDPQHRETPPSRELVVQGIGNAMLGLVGGIPISSVIVRSSVNLNAGAQTKLSAIFHGVLMLVAVTALPSYLNMIPLSCLAAILLVTGFKLVSPKLIKQMWHEGRYQFIPFAVTLIAIVFTDLVTGVLIGMAISIGFILNSNLRRPLRRIIEKHLGGDVMHIVLANQVSFLNRATLEKTLRNVEPGSHILLDAESTDYIDPDVLNLITNFKEHVAPVLGVQVSLKGFRKRYHMEDDIQFVDYSTRQLQEKLTSMQVLQILKDGNLRFQRGQKLTRDHTRQLSATAEGQNPIAVVLSCIDSRTPAELVFDLGIGDIFSIRIAGHVISSKVLGSLEYSCNVVGSKLILVMGHTRCGAVTSAVNLAYSAKSPEEATGCEHLEPIIRDIQQSIEPQMLPLLESATPEMKSAIVETVAIRNVENCVATILRESSTIARLVEEGRVAVVGAIFDVNTGKINFLKEDSLLEHNTTYATDSMIFEH